MKSNLMVIGNRKDDEARKPASEATVQGAAAQELEPRVMMVQEPALHGPAEQQPAAHEPALQVPSERKPFYEKDWGNERAVLSRLDGKLLADRRLYARVLYMHRIRCNTLFERLDSEPTLLMDPLELIVVDLSMGGIGVVCEHEILVGTILSFKLPLDNIAYEIKCEVVYCFENGGKYRAGLKLVDRDRNFIRHLKIFVARFTLQNMLGAEN